MATTAQRCKTCQRTLAKMPGSLYEICPVCDTRNFFNQTSQVPFMPSPPQLHWRINRIHKPRHYGTKKAVLCGITYNDNRKKLEASVRNVRIMQQLLVKKLGFQKASIHILTEEEADLSRIPTKRNILVALQWLVQGCQPGDSLLFYYAGHGCRIPNEDEDEDDWYDDALCPLDYEVSGALLDDEINAIIVAPLIHGVTLHSVVDTCCSGTVLDLPFLCKMNEDGLYNWEEQRLTNKGTRGGKAVCISACADNHYFADTTAFTGNAVGALTLSFIHTIESESKLTYARLLTSMRKKVNQEQQVVGCFAPHVSPTPQVPQLSSSKRFDIYSEPVIF